MKKKSILDDDINKIIVTVSIILLGVLGIYFNNFWGQPISDSSEDWGNFGSYVGGLLSPILAIGSLYYVIKTFKQQSFESMLNLLFEQHNNFSDNLSSKKDAETSKLETMLNKMGASWLGDLSENRACTKINEDYDIHRYVRILYQVLIYIDENCPTDKYKYSRIVRSFLSNDLIIITSLNCGQIVNGEIVYNRYKELVEKYSILEHMIINDKLTRELKSIHIKIPSIFYIIKRYDKKAFGDCVNINEFINNTLNEHLDNINYNMKEIENILDKYEIINELEKTISDQLLIMAKRELASNLIKEKIILDRLVALREISLNIKKCVLKKESKNLENINKKCSELLNNSLSFKYKYTNASLEYVVKSIIKSAETKLHNDLKDFREEQSNLINHINLIDFIINNNSESSIFHKNYFTYNEELLTANKKMNILLDKMSLLVSK